MHIYIYIYIYRSESWKQDFYSVKEIEKADSKYFIDYK